MPADLIASMRAAYRGCGPDHSVNRLLDYVETLERAARAVVDLTPEPEPRREDFIEQRQPAPEPEAQFEVVDLDGEVFRFHEAERACEAMRVILVAAARQGIDRLDGAVEDNLDLIAALAEAGLALKAGERQPAYRGSAGWKDGGGPTTIATASPSEQPFPGDVPTGQGRPATDDELRGNAAAERSDPGKLGGQPGSERTAKPAITITGQTDVVAEDLMAQVLLEAGEKAIDPPMNPAAPTAAREGKTIPVGRRRSRISGSWCRMDKINLDSNLPDCMMPDGAEPCDGYQWALRAIRDRDAEIAHLRGIVGDLNRENLLRDVQATGCAMELDEARDELGRLRAPPGADAMERARRMIETATRKHPGWSGPYLDLEVIARALQQYGDERAAAARAAAIEEAAQKHDAWAAKASARAASSYGRGNRLAQGYELTEARVHEASSADLRALAAKPRSK